MVTFQEIQKFMQGKLDEGRSQKFINVSADSLEEALQQASIELGLGIKKIDYEILDPGNKGMFGVGKKPTIILAYKAAGVEALHEESFGDMSFDDDEEAPVDGKFFIRKDEVGLMLRVSPPLKGGARVTERQVYEAIANRFHGTYDKALVGKILKRADDEFVPIGAYDHNSLEDALITIEIVDYEMKAYIMIRPPGPRGADPRAEDIIAFLRANNVVYGHLEEDIENIAATPPYNERLLVAQGQKPENGDDGRIVFNFETETSKIRLKEIDGKVDYKELNKINNVVEGQVLAKLVPPKRGANGHTVTGKALPAKDGKPAALEIGNNVKLSNDGSQALASANGQVLLIGGRITVEPVYMVNGNVDLKSGNILFLGSVVVKGSVEDGFAVKAAGNIEILGSVGRCELDAEGDIIVRQGINGKSSGQVRAGGSIWSKFIENSNVEASGYVVVSDGIINSMVNSDKKIICRGKRASIVGGNLRASEIITAKTLGSIAGMETLLEVGNDPKTKSKLEELQARKAADDKSLEEIKLNILTLEKAKKVKKELTPEKETFLRNLISQKNEIVNSIEEVSDEIKDTESYLAELKSNGKISASARVFPGVKVLIKDAPLEVRNEFKAVTFVYENGLVKVTRFAETEDEKEFGLDKG
ncbi:MAG: FapA family protein [Spirochaetales bacterium]|nr:FapA family protein [Spirochaetales bacterium]